MSAIRGQEKHFGLPVRDLNALGLWMTIYVIAQVPKRCKWLRQLAFLVSLPGFRECGVGICWPFGGAIRLIPA